MRILNPHLKTCLTNVLFDLESINFSYFFLIERGLFSCYEEDKTNKIISVVVLPTKVSFEILVVYSWVVDGSVTPPPL